MNNKQWTLIGSGIGVGAGLMFFLDPARGKRRRAFVRDKTTRAWNVTSCAVGKAARDLGNRARGAVSVTRSAFRNEKVSDDVLIERVRSKVGRAVSHAGAIDVSVRNGKVTLSGMVPERELDELLDEVSGVRGVKKVENRLEVQRTEAATQNHRWGRTVKVLAGTAGGVLALWAWARSR